VWLAYAARRFGAEGGDPLARLGPMRPWLALHALQSLVLVSALCARLGRVLRALPAGAEPPSGLTAVFRSGWVPSSMLSWWVDEMATAESHLERLGLLPADRARDSGAGGRDDEERAAEARLCRTIAAEARLARSGWEPGSYYI